MCLVLQVTLDFFCIKTKTMIFPQPFPSALSKPKHNHKIQADIVGKQKKYVDILIKLARYNNEQIFPYNGIKKRRHYLQISSKSHMLLQN